MLSFPQVLGVPMTGVEPSPVFQRGADGKNFRVPGEVAVDGQGRPLGQIRIVISLAGMGRAEAEVEAPLSVLEAAQGGLPLLRLAPAQGGSISAEITSRRDNFSGWFRLSGVESVEVVRDLAADAAAAPAASGRRGGDS